MNPELSTLVQTSSNLGVLESTRTGGTLSLRLCVLSRSSSESLLDAAIIGHESIARLAGATATTDNGYPGWEPNPASNVLATSGQVYRRVFGRDAEVTAIHAGLECGIINQRAGGNLDAVAFGPTITGAHSPDEQVSVESVARTWTFLKALLAEHAG
jgi:dipeptidase D